MNTSSAITKRLHPRNHHRHGYDFSALIASSPELTPYVIKNQHGDDSIDFGNPSAVTALNAALFSHHYNIKKWTIPSGALCPPIPGRADYIHYMAELLGVGLGGEGRQDSAIKMLDIGTGANGVYSLLACQLYKWQCVATDINSASLDNVSEVLAHNPHIPSRLSLRQQSDKNKIFEGIIRQGEMFDLSVCNPPFHASLEDAMKANQRKNTNLARNRGEAEVNTKRNSTLNFGGLEAELWCKGGEQLFLKKMIKESRDFSQQCRWFSSLVSKAENVKPAIKLMRKLGAVDVREIEMVQGNKLTRVLAWTFIKEV